MLQHAEKKNKVTYTAAIETAEAITCGGCGHVREQDAACPDWQCPGCSKAYDKVSPPEEEHISQQELRRMNQQYLEKKRKQENTRQILEDELEYPALKGIGAGFLTFLSGVGSACSAANPIVQIAGLVIVAGSVIYGLSYFWS